jgi:hypothetical protein
MGDIATGKKGEITNQNVSDAIKHLSDDVLPDFAQRYFTIFIMSNRCPP